MNKSSLQSAAPENPRDRLAAMLSVMAVQIDAALQESNAPAATLVETAHALGKATETVAQCVFDFSGSPARVFQDLMMLHDDMHSRAAKAATAIQFHDRLVQCLTHVSSSLTYVSEFLASGEEMKPAQWDNLQARIRSTLSMEQERELFDLLSGTAADAKPVKAKDEEGKIELF
jgi:ABC-type transporter Mla subunit MlaD